MLSPRLELLLDCFLCTLIAERGLKGWSSERVSECCAVSSRALFLLSSLALFISHPFNGYATSVQKDGFIPVSDVCCSSVMWAANKSFSLCAQKTRTIKSGGSERTESQFLHSSTDSIKGCLGCTRKQSNFTVDLNTKFSASKLFSVFLSLKFHELRCADTFNTNLLLCARLVKIFLKHPFWTAAMMRFVSFEPSVSSDNQFGVGYQSRWHFSLIKQTWLIKHT